MNSPNPTNSGTVAVPASTPTIGAIIGSIISSAVITHIPDPIAMTAAGTGITAFCTWLAHFLHSKLGTPE